MERENTTVSLAKLTAGQSFALTGGTVIHQDGSQSVSDIIVGADGRIVAVGPALDTRSCGACVDISGMLVSPGFVDAHQHLDKTGVLRFTPNPSGTLQGAREAFAKYARTAGPDDIYKRASRTVERCLSRGTTAIRSHINVDKDAGFHGIETLAGIRDGAKDRITLQLVAFMTPHPGQDFDWLAANIDGAVALADVVGGTPAVSEDPPRYLDILFSAAEKAGKPVDLHLDEHLKADVQLLDAALERVERFGMQGRTVFSHVSVLSAMPRAEYQRIAERMLALDVGAVTLPGQPLPAGPRIRDAAAARPDPRRRDAPRRHHHRHRLGQYPGSVRADRLGRHAGNRPLDAAGRPSARRRACLRPPHDHDRAGPPDGP